MKTFLVLMALAAIGCTTAKEINVEMASAQLIRIDTIYRSSDNPKQQLTWKDKDNIQYVSIVPMVPHYQVGTIISMLRQR